MSDDRFEEIVSSYADGKATPEELAELEGLMKANAGLRREFVERMRLEVSLGALHQSSAAVSNTRPTSSADRSETLSRSRPTIDPAATLIEARQCALWSSLARGWGVQAKAPGERGSERTPRRVSDRTTPATHAWTFQPRAVD